MSCDHILLKQVVHNNGKYSHPSNWAGYFLIGRDVVLMDRGKDLAKSVRCILQSPLDYLIAALKTLQAMVRRERVSIK